MTQQALLGAEHLVQVLEDQDITEDVWFYWRCSCGAGRRAVWDGIYSHREVAQARADDHLADAVGGAR